MSGEERVPIARTPRTAIYQRDRLTLYRYDRDTPPRRETPILLVYSLINRPSILDLQPRRSVVEQLLKHGFDVYLLDWGVPEPLDRFAGLDTYLDLYLRTVVRQVCKHAGRPQVTLFGYCMGGTLSAMFTALHPERVERLLLLGTPVWFRSDELLYKWGCDATLFHPRNVVEAFGNAPMSTFDGFNLLRLDTKPPRLLDIFRHADDEKFINDHLAMEQWINDGIPMAGKMYADFIEQCFQQNKLMSGDITVNGKAVRLENIQCPTLIVAGTADHLVPPEVATPLSGVIPNAQTILFETGHIGLSVSSKSHRDLWPRVCDWLGDATLLQQRNDKILVEVAI